MAVGEIAALGSAGVLLAALLAAILIERRQRRKLLSILYYETAGLCREAAELAETICVRQADGGIIDQDVLDRYALTEPQTYPGLVPSLWRLPSDLAWRAVEFHGQLCLARTRLAGWRCGERGRVSTYLLVSALTRSANSGHGLLWESARRLGRRQRWKPDMRSASRLVDRMESPEPELMDWGYWSDPSQVFRPVGEVGDG